MRFNFLRDTGAFLWITLATLYGAQAHGGLMEFMDPFSGGEGMTTSPRTRSAAPQSSESFEDFYKNGASNAQQAQSLDTLCDCVDESITTHVFGPQKRDEMNVLCFDGGGVRAIATLTLLCQLEIKTGKKVYELFDRLYGTSTGGIAALLFGFGYSAPQVLDIYFDHMKDVFHKGTFSKFSNPFGLFSSNFDNQGLTYIINRYMHPTAVQAIQQGETLTHVRQMMDQLEKVSRVHAPVYKLRDAKVPVSVVAKNNQTHATVILSSDDEATYDNLVLHAALATSAAPTYFNAQDVRVNGKVITCVDGGITANNPSLQAYKHIKLNKLHMNSQFPHDKSKRKKIHMLSLGTGFVMDQPLDKNTGKLGFGSISNVPHYFMNSAALAINGDMLEIAAKKPYFEYTRVSFELPERIDLADTSEHAKKILQDAAMQVVFDKSGSFNVYVKDREEERRKAQSNPGINSGPYMKTADDDASSSPIQIRARL